MPAEESATGYFIWGADQKAYGPVELPTLVSWIKDERVLAETWVFLERSGCWEKAEHATELQMFFHNRPAGSKEIPTTDTERLAAGGLTAGLLHHIKILAGLNDEQLIRFVQIMQVKQISQGAQLAKQGDQGDAMYLLVEGELRLRSRAEGRDITIGTIQAGEFLGEITLFDQGPRSADIIATLDSTLVKISAAEFEKFVYEMPDLAAPFLFAIAKTLTSRIRADNRRYRDSIAFVRPPGAS
jgi:CRP-like cAMP-binding protein